MENLTIKIVRFERMPYINLVAVGFFITATDTRQIYREVCLPADTVLDLSELDIANQAWTLLEKEVAGWLTIPVPPPSDVINMVYTPPPTPAEPPQPTQAPVVLQTILEEPEEPL